MTAEESAESRIKLSKVIHTSHVKARYTQLPTSPMEIEMISGGWKIGAREGWWASEWNMYYNKF